MENRKDTIEELNDILAKTHDSVEGFREAAANVNDNRLMSYFNEQVITRKAFVTELEREIRSLGGEPAEDGTIAGTLHRGWINFKSSFSTDNTEEVLEECIRGEKNCIEEYDDLLEETHLPISTRQLLIKQKLMVEKTLLGLEIKEEIHDN